MSSFKKTIGRHSIPLYYALTFFLSWGGILLAVGGPKGIPGTPELFEKLMPLLIPAMLGGPTLAGLLMTGLVYGKQGFRDLFSRLFKQRLGGVRFAVVFITAPLLMAALPLVVSLFRPEYIPRIFSQPDTAGLLRLGIAAGLGAGIFEEIGWTGFVIPRLRRSHGVLSTGLLVGFLWGAWHLLVNVWSSGDVNGNLSLPLFLHSFLFSAGILPAFRIMMVWVYERSGSLLGAMLLHMSLTTSNVLFVPEKVDGAIGVVWSLIIAAAMWLLVAIIITIGRRKRSHASLEKEGWR